jgi:type II secretory pathway component PulL
LIYSVKNDLPIIIHEKIYEKINECHIAVGHSGRDKTWAEVIIIFFYAKLYSDVI